MGGTRAWDARKAFRLAVLGLAVFLLVQVLAVAAREPLDLDGDGLSTAEERERGTDAYRADTDGDGLPDGWEVARGLGPLSRDSDGDGIPDGAEVAIGSDPLSRDSDGDGIPDLEEWPEGAAWEPDAGLAAADCDGNGVPAILDTDDDADGRWDGDEPVAHRCSPDVDGDGVLDGHEGAPLCIERTDCDGDGVPDGLEGPNGFDPLNPDTYGVHLPDSVGLAFQQAGQPIGADADGDGIPDPWESGSGLIDWGPFSPTPGSQDLLVEFVRVVGPDSSRFTNLDLAPAYVAVRGMFVSAGVNLQFAETVVRLDPEPIPDILPTRDADYYRRVLDKARWSANPYVLTIVVNPQLDQSEVLHSGVAPLRGMLAAVDLSQYVQITLVPETGSGSFTGSPFVESVIRVGRYTGGGIKPDGSYFVTFADGELRWTPFWLKEPVFETNAGQLIPLRHADRALDARGLASVIAHEMGHTLGLCHTHEASCRALLPAAQWPDADRSTMSYNAPDTALFFLPGEWERVHGFLACPPPEPVRLVAQAAGGDAVLSAKYDYSLEEEVEVRACRDFEAVARTMTPRAPAFHATPFALPAPFVTEPLPPRLWDAGGVLAGLAVAALPLTRAWRRGGLKVPPPLPFAPDGGEAGEQKGAPPEAAAVWNGVPEDPWDREGSKPPKENGAPRDPPGDLPEEGRTRPHPPPPRPPVGRSPPP